MHIETPRLLLRPFTPDDFEDYFAYIMDRQLQVDLGLEGVDDRDCALVNFQWLMDNREFIALESRESGRVIGHICVHPPYEKLADDPAFRGRKGASLSFAIAKRERRKGLMLEALRALLAELFQNGGLDYVDCEYACFNTASQALQEKLGFRLWGTERMGDVELAVNVLAGRRLRESGGPRAFS